MANKILLKRGLNANLPTLGIGEPGFTTDNKELWIGASGGNVKIGPGAGGVTTWLALTDTPGAYTGQAGKYTKVNAGETALEFITLPGGGDMLKSIYDTGDNGVVDNSEKLEGSTKVQVRDHTPKSHIHYLEALKPLSVLLGSGQDVLLTATAIELQIRNAADSAYQSLRASKLYAEDYVYTDEIRELTGAANITFAHKAIFNAHLNTNNIYERTAGSGVTVDYCLIKDGTAAHTEVTKTSEITFATTDQSTGKAFTITDFIKHGMIKKVKFRANMTAGQLTTVSALVNDATGLAPADTSLAFDGKSGTFTNGDYLAIQDEIVKINDADPNTSPITIVRAQKGTTASYLDDNVQITKLNNGFKLQLFKDSNKKPKEMVLELSALMTAVGTTDAAISASDKKIELSADLKNVDNNDTVRIADTTSEEALVQHNTGDVVTAAYDFILYVYDSLAAHNTAKSVEKVCVYDIPIPYKSAGTTLYGQIQLEEASLAANKTLNIELIIDKYS